MKIAIIDKKDITLQIQNNAIKFEEQTIPFRFMDILILNHRATLHTKDILKLTKENISILIISYNNDSFSLTSSANTKNGDIKLAQYTSLDKKIEFAKYFITQKLISHKEQLEVNGVENIDIKFQLEQLKNATQIDAIMGIEGSFARLYFQEFFNILPREYHKGKRSKKPPQDPVNALMSYWYSLYYNIITVKLLSYGFEPAMGYLHTPFRSHNALSSDILELFRSAINQAVLSVFKHNTLTLEDFTKKGGVYLKYEGRKKVWSEFVELVDTLKPKLDNEIANLKKMINETNNCN
ncbi:CRISPR-associated endonuclease Cas1 [Sulfurimonas sp. NW15]|uniref:CRISPR-associated endonuclease Cas1 n=1 Tax=Sulfurimonas sp. NW15 TaxID=2922729 RepID=UPI003DA8B06F